HVRLRTMTLPDRFIDHNSQFEQYNVAELNAPHIVHTALNAIGVSEGMMESVSSRMASGIK
ncbi:hypothetical protein, partial [Acetobacter fallax]